MAIEEVSKETRDACDIQARVVLKECTVAGAPGVLAAAGRWVMVAGRPWTPTGRIEGIEDHPLLVYDEGRGFFRFADGSYALTTAYEFKESGDEIPVVFAGAGTKWVGKLSDPDHRLHRAFRMVRDEVAGACKACAVPFGVRGEVEASGIPLLTE